MILLLTDVHCLYGVVNQQVTYAEATQGQTVAAVLILGDVGLYEPQLKRYFRRGQQRFQRPTYFIEGNHEDHDHLPELVAAYGDVLTYLPRSSIRVLAGHRFLCLGGSSYMDAHTTPRAAVIGPEDIQACLSHPAAAADIVISHDCPSGIGVPNTPGFEHYGAPGFAGSDQIQAHFAPRLWIFGHHHKWYDRSCGGTRFVGLAQSWQGFAMLHADGHLEVVRHHVDLQPSPWQRFRRWCRGGH
jgi:predicted phosphodiesterase